MLSCQRGLDVGDDDHAVVVRVKVLGEIVDVLLEDAVHREQSVLERPYVDLLEVRLLIVLLLLDQDVLQRSSSVP